MNKEARFQEMLKDLCMLAKVNQNSLKKPLIEEFFAEMQLTSQQMHLIYAYLKEQKIQVILEDGDEGKEEREEGIDKRKGPERAEKQPEGGEGIFSDDNRIEELCREILKGDTAKKQMVLEVYQPKIADYVKTLKHSGIPQEDLIQDASLGLLLALEALELKPEEMSFAEYLESGLEEEIRSALEEEYQAKKADEQLERRMNAFHERILALTEELERKPTLEEVCFYTKKPKEEVKYYFRLMGKEV